MDIIIKRMMAVGCLTFMLTGCNTLFPASEQGRDQPASRDGMQVSQTSYDASMGTMSGEPVESRGSVGGQLAYNMDNRDRAKLSKGLDNAIGQPAKWTNYRTGTKYTVVPVSKTSSGGNPFCRNYRITAVNGGQTDRASGTACLGSDGSWHPRSG